MIQILHFIDGKRCFVKERGIYFERPAGTFLFLSLEVMSLKSNNADLQAFKMPQSDTFVQSNQHIG